MRAVVHAQQKQRGDPLRPPKPRLCTFPVSICLKGFSNNCIKSQSICQELHARILVLPVQLCLYFCLTKYFAYTHTHTHTHTYNRARDSPPKASAYDGKVANLIGGSDGMNYPRFVTPNTTLKLWLDPALRELPLINTNAETVTYVNTLNTLNLR